MAPNLSEASAVDEEILDESSDAEVPAKLVKAWSASPWSNSKTGIAPVPLF